MEDPRQYRNPNKDESGSGKGTAVLDASTMPKPGELKSLEQFMADREEDAWEVSAYVAYGKLLGAAFKQSATKPESIRQQLLTAQGLLSKYLITPELNVCLNTAYQGLCGPRPGDDLRRITPNFLVDGHQWKHYKNGDFTWGLFSGKWEEVHKIIQYGAKLILAEWAKRIDLGETVKDQLMDGYVQFDQNVGTPGGKGAKPVSLIKIQISRTSKQVAGHGYPVPSADEPNFPEVKGNYATALNEVLTPDNNSIRSKT